MVLVDLGKFDDDSHACTSKVDCANIGKSPYPRAGEILAADRNRALSRQLLLQSAVGGG